MARRRKRNNRVSPLRALADLNVAISETAEYRQARRDVLMRFARVVDGKPALCAPPMREQRLGHIPGAFKVIYDSRDNALGAAREFGRLGAPPQAPYPCEWGDHFHTHTLDKYCDEKKRGETA